MVIDGELYVGANAMVGKVGYLAFSTGGRRQFATELVSAEGFVAATLRLIKSLWTTPARK